MLALGWLSVESVRGAENHQHRVREINPGQSLTAELADHLLRGVLSTCKGVTQEVELARWIDDCLLALTANIRPDAVIVNRAASFAEWQRTVGPAGSEMPEQARRILFAMCGDGFASLTLPDEAALKDDAEADADTSEPDSEQAAASQAEADEAVEPSKASRGVFGDLFGGDATEKLSRAAGKHEFADDARRMLMELDGIPPTREVIIAFRKQQDWPDLEASRSEKYPQEVSSSGAPTDVAKRYRKLLVCLKLWPTSAEENGIPRPSAVSRYGKQVTARDEHSRNAHINALDLIDACPAPARDTDESSAGPASDRVFTPPWATALAEGVAAATNMPMDAKPLNEFKRLMFAMAARRISQTQTWTKRNEAERHKAAVKEDAAKKKLEELDGDNHAQTWFTAYEERRADRSGSTNGFRVTRRMIGECDAVFKAWHGTRTPEDREKQTASIQTKAEKFGDGRLYADLSEDPAGAAIWQHDQGGEILKQWVKLRQAQHDQQRLKIPRFCHPDPFHHPTWCEFGGSSKPKVWYAWKPDTKPQNPEAGGDADASRRLWMLLPDFSAKQAKAVPMRWCSKRLSNDLGGVGEVVEESIPRADRLSVAVAKLPVREANGQRIRYRPEHPFTKDAKGWNARLQVSRDTLEHLEKQWDDARCIWRDGGKALRCARWFITFAPALAVSESLGYKIHPKLHAITNSNPHGELDKKQKRKWHAQLGLSRLTGLRVLSVDLGHRYAAACAVWQTLSEAEFKKEIAGREVADGNAGKSSLYLHTRHTDPKTGKVRTTVYRRIGNDSLGDKSSHPAPWARLDRQFLIKLQGEEKPARKASAAEYESVQQLEAELGFVRDATNALPWRVDGLMSEAVRTARLALRRHGDIARLAYAFKPGAEQHAPGGGVKEHTPDTRKAALLAALLRWHDIATADRWRDQIASAAWFTHIAPRLTADLPMLAEDPDRSERKRHAAAIEKALEPIAAELAKSGTRGVPALHALWKERWEQDEGRWGIRLKSLRRWLTPRGLRARSDDSPATAAVRKARRRAAQNVGGLSLDRIATIRELYQVQKAHRYKPNPDDLRAGVKLMEDDAAKGYKFGNRTLQAMERMREQRVKQIASRIVEAALGVGRMSRTKGRDRKRPQSQVDALCHAIVIENLRNYRPEEVQTRRENKALMNWSAGKVRKYLEEGCQLHGLHLREVMPNYTSRQCSRTGRPGVRCQDVAVDAETGEAKAWWWKKAVASAAGKGDEESKLLVDLDQRIRAADGERPATVRVPRRGGDLFVAAGGDGRAIQADLNAAANIGLRALLDPDFIGKWWYVPCDTTTGKPAKDKCAGAACLDLNKPYLPEVQAKDGEGAKGNAKAREKINAWRDVGSAEGWMVHAAYWFSVQKRVAQVLRPVNGLQ